MICHYCCRGYIADGSDVRPCPECGGSGLIHCCEGERPDECPEHSRETTPEPPVNAVDETELGAAAHRLIGEPESRDLGSTRKAGQESTTGGWRALLTLGRSPKREYKNFPGKKSERFPAVLQYRGTSHDAQRL